MLHVEIHSLSPMTDDLLDRLEDQVPIGLILESINTLTDPNSVILNLRIISRIPLEDIYTLVTNEFNLLPEIDKVQITYQLDKNVGDR